MIKRHEVQVLLAAGFTQQQVVKATGVSKRSVTRIAEERPVQGLEETGVAAERRVGRRSTVEDFRSELNAWLEEDPDLPTVELLHRLRQRGYKGGKTAVYDWVRRLRGPAPSRVMVRFEGLPGEFAQFDFGEVRVRYLSGRTETIQFAAYRLKYARWVYVEPVPNQQVEPLCRSLLRGFEGSGGVPLLVVVDNPKTVVIHPKKDPIVWNRTFAQVAVDYGPLSFFGCGPVGRSPRGRGDPDPPRDIARPRSTPTRRGCGVRRRPRGTWAGPGTSRKEGSNARCVGTGL